MPDFCAAYGCSHERNIKTRQQGITFHRRECVYYIECYEISISISKLVLVFITHTLFYLFILFFNIYIFLFLTQTQILWLVYAWILKWNVWGWLIFYMHWDDCYVICMMLWQYCSAVMPIKQNWIELKLYFCYVGLWVCFSPWLTT